MINNNSPITRRGFYYPTIPSHMLSTIHRTRSSMSYFSILISLCEIPLKNHNPLISQQFCILNKIDHTPVWGVIFIIGVFGCGGPKKVKYLKMSPENSLFFSCPIPLYIRYFVGKYLNWPSVGREGVEPSRCHHRRILSPDPYPSFSRP